MSVKTEETLFIEAVELPDPIERCAYLDRACGGDAALRDRLERLLDQHGRAGSFLGHPPAGSTETASFVPGEESTLTVRSASESIGAVIGPYKLLQQIGEGGMARSSWRSRPSRSNARSH